jgi:sn-glycerol 3-phosphate transport system substrate-binding protein
MRWNSSLVRRPAGSAKWFEQNPQYPTAFDQLITTGDTTATRGVQIGPFDTVRIVIEVAVDSMDGSSSVRATLEGLGMQVEKQFQRDDSDR